VGKMHTTGRRGGDAQIAMVEALQAVKASISREQHLHYLSRLRQQDLVDGFARRRAARIIQRAYRNLLVGRKKKKKAKKGKKGVGKGKPKSAAGSPKKQAAVPAAKRK